MTGQHPGLGCPHGELAVGWALHALEPAEEILVAAHLPDCSECTRTVAETEQVGAVLGLSVSMATPSAELAQRVLAVAGTTQISPPEPVTPPEPATHPAPPRVQRRRGRSPQTPATWALWGAPRSNREPRFCVPDTLKLLVAALLVLAIAVTIVFVVLP